MNSIRKIILVVLLLTVLMPLAQATYTPFNTATTGNIGIGSATPGQKLDVQGTVRATAFSLGGSSITSWPAGGASNWTYTSSGNIGLSTTVAVGIGTSFIGGSGEGALTVMNGNVGIGTWVPAGALVVMNGNVGIGLPNPTNKLDIQDNTAGTPVQFNVNDSVNNGRAFFSMSNDQSNSVGIQMSGSQYNTPSFYNQAYFITSGSTVAGLTFETNGGQASGGTTPIYFQAGGNAINPQMTILPSNNIGIGTTTPAGGLTVMNGNVGIGTWVPAAALQIGSGQILVPAGSSGAPSISSSVDNTTGFYFSSGNILGAVGGNQRIALTNSSVSFVTDIDFNSGGNQSIMNISNADLILGANSGEAIRIRNSGNVGIGSTVPGSVLDVQGTVRFLGVGNVGIDSVAPGQSLDVQGTVRATAFSLGGSSITSWPAGGGSNYWLNDSGNIGINTTYNIGIGTLSQKNSLNIVGNIGIGTFSYDPYLKTAAPNGGMIISGNVGIGTYAPLQPLELRSTGSTVFRVDTSGSNLNPAIDLYGQPNNATFLYGQINFGFDSNNTTQADIKGIRSSVNGSDISFETANAAVGTLAEKMRINSEGNLGIGTTTPVGGLVVMSGNVGIGTWVPGAALQVNNTMSFQSEFSNGNSGTSKTINWNNGNKQKATLTGNCTFTFTAPSGGVTNILLKLVQDGTGSRTVTWPGTVEWSGGLAPVLSTAAAAIDIVTCYYDGTNYFCAANLNFQV